MDIMHFTLGKNAGQLLMNIAHEHFIYDLDPNRGLEDITKVLIGIPVDIAIEILFGSKVLEVADDKVSMNVVDRDNSIHCDYPKIDIHSFINDKQKWIEDKGKDISDMQLSVMREINSNGGKYDVNIDLPDLLYSFFETKEIPISKILNDNPNIDILFLSCKLAKEYLDKAQKIWSIFEFINRYYTSKLEFDYNYNTVSKVSERLSLIIEKQYDDINKAINEYDDTPLKRTIDAELKISKHLKQVEYIQPVDIEDSYSAGWLSPDGSFFGLNGEIANMLHNKLADAIRERIKILDGKDPLTDNDINMDGYLSQNGWVKIHGDNILYDGYEQSRYGLPLVPITDKQISQIVLYGNKCQKGKLFFGIDRKFCSASRFGMIERPMLCKLFDF